jgi:GAF domain-containing protein
VKGQSQTTATGALVLEQGGEPSETSAEFRVLFHRLNNQLGIVLAHAELLEAKAADQTDRTRATQVVTSVLDAMSTAREIRHRTEKPEADAALD